MENMSALEINMDWKSRQIYNPYVFIDLKRSLNWLKSKITKIEENLNQGINQKFTIGKVSVASMHALAHPNVAGKSRGYSEPPVGFPSSGAFRGLRPLEKVLRP